MKNRLSSEIKVGITVIVGIIILLFGFSEFKDWSVTQSFDTINIRFPTSGGLQISDPVFINGVKVGKVTRVAIEGNTVLVTASIDKQTHLSSDAVVKIQVLELMGGKKIEILQGVSNAPMNYSEVINGRVDPDFGSALGLLGTVQDKVTDIGNNANTLLINANDIIGDKKLVAGIKAMAANLQTISADVRALIHDNRAESRQIIQSLTRISARADTLLAELEPRIVHGIDQADRTMVQVDSLLADVRSLVATVRDSRGLVHKLLTDTTMNRRLDDMIVKLDSLSGLVIDGQMRIKIRL